MDNLLLELRIWAPRIVFVLLALFAITTAAEALSDFINGLIGFRR